MIKDLRELKGIDVENNKNKDLTWDRSKIKNNRSYLLKSVEEDVMDLDYPTGFDNRCDYRQYISKNNFTLEEFMIALNCMNDVYMMDLNEAIETVATEETMFFRDVIITKYKHDDAFAKISKKSIDIINTEALDTFDFITFVNHVQSPYEIIRTDYYIRLSNVSVSEYVDTSIENITKAKEIKKRVIKSSKYIKKI